MECKYYLCKIMKLILYFVIFQIYTEFRISKWKFRNFNQNATMVKLAV